MSIIGVRHYVFCFAVVLLCPAAALTGVPRASDHDLESPSVSKTDQHSADVVEEVERINKQIQDIEARLQQNEDAPSMQPVTTTTTTNRSYSVWIGVPLWSILVASVAFIIVALLSFVVFRSKPKEDD